MFCMGNLKFFGLKFNDNVQNWITLKFFYKYFFFLLEFCAYIYLFYTFSVLLDNVAIFLIIWSYYLQQDELTKWCMDITYNLCPSFWVQVLHSLLLNPQYFNKYFDTVYNNFHIFIDLNLYLSTWRIWWALNNGSKGQMGFNSAFKVLNVYIMTWFCKTTDVTETTVPPCKCRQQISHKYLLPYITLLALHSWRPWTFSSKQIVGCNWSQALEICSVLAIDGGNSTLRSL